MIRKPIWQNDTTVPRFIPLDDDLSTDVLIIGGGIAGILCAYMLSKHGIDCCISTAPICWLSISIAGCRVCI